MNEIVGDYYIRGTEFWKIDLKRENEKLIWDR